MVENAVAVLGSEVTAGIPIDAPQRRVNSHAHTNTPTHLYTPHRKHRAPHLYSLCVLRTVEGVSVHSRFVGKYERNERAKRETRCGV